MSDVQWTAFILRPACMYTYACVGQTPFLFALCFLHIHAVCTLPTPCRCDVKGLTQKRGASTPPIFYLCLVQFGGLPMFWVKPIYTHVGLWFAVACLACKGAKCSMMFHQLSELHSRQGTKKEYKRPHWCIFLFNIYRPCRGKAFLMVTCAAVEWSEMQVFIYMYVMQAKGSQDNCKTSIPRVPI